MIALISVCFEVETDPVGTSTTTSGSLEDWGGGWFVEEVAVAVGLEQMAPMIANRNERIPNLEWVIEVLVNY